MSDLLTETQRALAAMVIERDEMAAKYTRLLRTVDEMREEENASYELISRQGDLLRGVVNALKGEPPPDTLWSVHDAPQLAAAMVAALHLIAGTHGTECSYPRYVAAQALKGHPLAQSDAPAAGASPPTGAPGDIPDKPA